MAIGAGPAGVAAGVDEGHQGVGRGADHRLQVHAGVRQRGDGQRPLLAQLQDGARRGEPGACRGPGGEQQRDSGALRGVDLSVFIVGVNGLSDNHAALVPFSYRDTYVTHMF